MVRCRILRVNLPKTVIRSQSRTIRWNDGLMKSKTNCWTVMRRSKMTTETIDPQHFAQKARQIRAQVSTVLTRWGLLPRFKRWRLSQDPGTGMVVLFGILNNRYIATHTSIAFRDYFQPGVLHDLADALQVQVVSCNSDG